MFLRPDRGVLMNLRRTLAGLMTTAIAVQVIAGGVGTARGQCQAQQIAKLSDSTPFAQYFFGHSVAMDGDVVVIGAYRDWTADHEAGAVFVYRYSGSGWVEEAQFLAADAASDDEFGVSVGVSGNTIVVGSHFDDGGGVDSGAAYVFLFDGSRWKQVAKLTASDTMAYDNFGYSVAIDGDVVAVGANLDDHDGGVNSGSAYIFEKPGGGWTDMTETVKLVASDAEVNDEFGKSISVSDDTAVIGAHYDTTGSADLSGSAYVFRNGVSGWTQAAKLTASDPSDQDRFGLSVAIDGDVVVAGAWADDDGGTQTGSAYVFDRPLGGWTDMIQTAKLTASDAEAGDHLGWSVAVDGDHVVVGAPAHLWDGSGYGTAYVYERPAGGWADAIETARYTASDHAQDDAYGNSVAVDGFRAVVGAPFHKTAGYYGAGASYIHGGLADCQPNGVLDTCDVAGSTSADDNANGVPDECEAAGGGSGTVKESLIADKAGEDEITLFWDVSCIGTDNHYAIYEGTLGDFSSHSARFCSISGEVQITFLPAEGDTYYLVVPRSAVQEGSYGLDGDGQERPAAVEPCLPRVTAECP
jgi:hypothetical protein